MKESYRERRAKEKWKEKDVRWQRKSGEKNRGMKIKKSERQAEIKIQHSFVCKKKNCKMNKIITVTGTAVCVTLSNLTT